MTKQLEGKVAIVTGAASGMGKAITELFTSEGAKVIAADLNFEGVKAVTDSIGPVAYPVEVNVAKQADIDKMFATAKEQFDKVDIVVNNAGIMDNMAPLGNMDDATWERVMSINVNSVMMSTRAALKEFLPQKSGVILNTASMGGQHGGVAGAAYVASKHAVVGLTKNTAYMYEAEGIRCNAIAPGGINTNIGSSMKNVDKFGADRQAQGLKLMYKPGEASDIANTALFLVSDAAQYVNGAIVPVDGGMTAY
ncbi:SDR family oxidoreductase [Ligilactobacillus acidipiscis]|uniref:SDR family oxidoreductase n=1 Tax=Ligilactobacillus acidipiscis TaxID=89059 RepID=A0A921K0S7_9LACO|nr:SDR family oxidoreductase [Ligilactobacillus acidipiscis]WEV57153.1 SDR family oxidoreductase [Ligilactobacillus acidipiscis]HJE96861.1 SDR family oxidoreductase [Ligilactobacillus acidipiscis]